MIFEAEPEQIEALDSKQLVQLMKLLIFAECRVAQIPLRATHVPMQITISDGGEDGRVEWSEGAASTPFFARRFCVFQAKAQNLTDASIRNEVLKKAAAKKRSSAKAKRGKKAKKSPTRGVVLSEALATVLKKRGSYTILSTSAFIGKKRDKLIKAAQAAVKDGGGTTSRIVIDVLDANKIADWVNTHPSVALWLAKLSRRRSLAGFQTHEGWGKAHDIRVSPWVGGNDARFIAVNVSLDASSPAKPTETIWTFDEAAAAVLKQLEEDQQSVRIAGPSGYGKSRFAYEVFNQAGSLAGQVDAATMIYADYSIVGDELVKLALEIAESGSAATLVVDECPDLVHTKLSEIAQRADSRLRILTIDVETKIVSAEKTLTLKLEPASKDTIAAIAKGVDPNISDTNVGLIHEFAHGFPQMAVLAAQKKGTGRGAIQSADQYVDRVIWGSRTPNDAARKALSILSMFEWMGIAGPVSGQAAYIAEHLAGMLFDTFVEHIKSFKNRGVLVVRGDFAQVQPIPLAVRLATSQLGLLADNKLVAFFMDAPRELQQGLLRRIRWFDTVPEVKTLARTLLEGAFSEFDVLNTDFGAQVLDQLVHVEPDLAMATIDRVFGSLSIDELQGVTDGRRHLVWALEKLAFRKETFETAARLLRRLGTAEIEDRISNNAAGQFKGLYSLYLSGTEAAPDVRLVVLDEGLESGDPNERALCVDALDEMLETGHYSRSGGSDQIGSGEPLKDWQPKTYGEIRDFFRAALSRLTRLVLNNDPFGAKAKVILGQRLRSMFNQLQPNEVRSLIDKIVGHGGFWPEALQEINEWLYFDGKAAPKDVREQIRRYFDELLPADPILLVVMYCKGWHGDFHDPDTNFERDDRKGTDYDYPVRKSVELAEKISGDDPLVRRAIEALATSDAKSSFGFARRLAERVAEPLGLFRDAVTVAEGTNEPPSLRFFGGLISGAEARDPKVARECIRLALRSAKLKPFAIDMIGSGTLQPDDIKLVVSLLKSGDVNPMDCATLSYGRRMDHLSPEEIAPLIEELMLHKARGLWTALDIIFMYLYPSKPLDIVLERQLRAILVSSGLFEQSQRNAMDGHHLQESVAMLATHRKLRAPYVRSLTRQLLSLIKTENSDVFFALDDPVRAALNTLMKEFPAEVWNVISPVLLSAKGLERHRLEGLIRADRDDTFGAGPLFALPPDMYLAWVRDAPTTRAVEVMRWLPIASKNDTGSLSWTKEVEAFVNEFGTEPGVLGELGRRMHPSTWWGSVVPFIEPWLPLLRTWQSHRLAEVRAWARERIQLLENYIAAEKKRDEEQDVR
ncbi:hypothetical protein SSBR45G_49850 [Bradyrhizobium sp. SSBR45G]|uniref:hypothetical protein n=1 Tax=unclassified Bradyrhizobium TaxID=2631580 RepID=UPI002342A9E4|nr:MULTISPECIES: hypothetical protein [unclassified Bradyrhizobium]GLH80076.1 hypothetical protein SSBR45G_49850 [Bradyrhizobium sp. SSBR45G]GLH87615.1 hypothetical protein SSBR45R_50750 [Bradyrhizobium sp. SSBR45R]